MVQGRTAEDKLKLEGKTVILENKETTLHEKWVTVVRAGASKWENGDQFSSIVGVLSSLFHRACPSL